MRLKELREKNGLTQTELAAQAGVHPMMISKLERGISNPESMSVGTALKIAHALHVTVEGLMAEDDRPKGLKAIRENRGLSQRKLAKKSGIHPNGIAYFETGARSIENANASTVFSLADALCCDPRDLLAEPTPSPLHDVPRDFDKTPQAWRELEKERKNLFAADVTEEGGGE